MGVCSPLKEWHVQRSCGKEELGVCKKSRGTRPRKHEGQHGCKMHLEMHRQGPATQNFMRQIKDLGLYLDSDKVGNLCMFLAEEWNDHFTF